MEKKIKSYCTCAHCDTYQKHVEGIVEIETEDKEFIEKVEQMVSRSRGICFEDINGNKINEPDDLQWSLI